MAWHRQFNSLPAEIRDLSLLEIYDRIEASMRTVHYYTDQPDPVEWSWAPDVQISQQEQDGVRKIWLIGGSVDQRIGASVDRCIS